VLRGKCFADHSIEGVSKLGTWSPPVEDAFRQRKASDLQGLHVISYRATLDVPDSTLTRVTAWLSAYRHAHDVRPWQRAASARTQAVMVLRWFRHATDLSTLARDAGISLATAYRYLHEAITVIADHVPDLHEAISAGRQSGWLYVCLDGTLIPTSRCTAKNPDSGHDLWFSGKHKQHGGNIQVLTDQTGYPVWVSPVTPGSTHDITAARAHVLPALYPAAAEGMKTLCDKGYVGAGIGILVPAKGSKPCPDTQTRNQAISALRAPAERANALLKATWRALRRITLDPWKITDIVAAALVLLHLQRGSR
jgi:hypothetical protein